MFGWWKVAGVPALSHFALLLTLLVLCVCLLSAVALGVDLLRAVLRGVVSAGVALVGAVLVGEALSGIILVGLFGSSFILLSLIVRLRFFLGLYHGSEPQSLFLVEVGLLECVFIGLSLELRQLGGFHVVKVLGPGFVIGTLVAVSLLL